MAYRYQKLRLKLPSLCQFNSVDTSNDWCGRTSASMIYNYYYLVSQGKTLEAARDDLIANVPGVDKGLVFRDSLEKKKSWSTDGGRHLAALSSARTYHLLWTLQEGSALVGEHDDGVDWHQQPKGYVAPLDPPDQRSDGVPSEADVQLKLAPLIEALEKFNPVLFYSGLSANEKHIVVISGYALRRGKLWLHIDDPQKYRKGEKSAIGGYIGDALATLKENGEVDRIPEAFIEDVEPDFAVDGENPGIRYWLRARVLFYPNARTEHIHDDIWADHGDPSKKRDGSNRWGMSVYYTFLDTPRTDLVEAVPFATYPVRLPGKGPATDAVLSQLWDAVARSGAPYPLDKFRIWNNGIRIPHEGSGVASADVVALAPGQLVAARFGKPASPGDPSLGMVIVRHAYDEAVQNFVEFPTGKLPSHQKLVFSLYARLAAPASPGTSALIERAKPGPPVQRTQRLQPGDQAVLLVEQADGSGALQQLEGAPNPGAPARGDDAERPHYTVDDLFPATVDGADRHVVPLVAAETNLHHWHERPRPPAAPAGTALHYLNPLGPPMDTKEAAKETNGPRLAADLSEEPPRLVHVEDAGSWYALESYDEPGVDLSLHRHAAYTEVGELQALSGSNVLVVQAKTLRFTAEGVSGTRTITLGGNTATARLVCTGATQPAFADEAADGAAATPALVAIVPKDRLRGNGDEVKSSSVISYWDPRTDAVYTTSAKTAKQTPVEGHRGTPEGYVAIQGHVPQLQVTHKHTFVHSAADVDALCKLEPDAFPLVCVQDPTLYLSTNASRKFPEARKVPLEGRMRFRGTPKFVSNRMRLWPELTPVGALSAEQAQAAQAELEASFSSDKVAVLERLSRGESALVGVFVDGKGWVLDGNVLRVEDGRTEDLALHPKLDRARGFYEKKLVQPIKATPGLSIPVVCVFEAYSKRRAFIEVRYAAAELRDNASAVAAWELQNAVYQTLFERLSSNTLLNLAKLEEEVRASLGHLEGIEKVSAHAMSSWRDVAASVIGTMGRTDGNGNLGVHVEVFSKDYIIPPVNAARWPKVEEDVTPEPQGTQPYFSAQHKAITVKDKLRAAGQRGKSSRQSTPKTAEWEEYCAENHRLLSRLVGWHRNQWLINWGQIAGAAGEEHSMATVLEAIPDLEEAGLNFAALGVPGLGDESFHYYHPLRLVEWLTTGMDVSVRDLDDATDGAPDCQLKIDGELLELVRPYPNDALFRLRLVLSDPATASKGSKPAGGGELLLDGLRTSPDHDVLPILLKRGQVGMYAFTEPGGSLTLAQHPAGFGLPEELTGLRADYDGLVHLLADGNEKLGESGVARVKVRAAARYNLEMPPLATVTLGGAGIELDEFAMSGAKAVKPRAEMRLEPAEGDPPRRYPKQSREVTFRMGLTPTRSTKASATLTIAFSGGDLEAEWKQTLRIKTREIQLDHRGEDVAKLQLYLSRIRAGNTPCYARRKDEEGQPIRERRTIDGSYGAFTAEALWRFILFFSPMDDWPEDWTSIKTNGAAVQLDREDRNDENIEVRVAELLAAEAYPTVDHAMIDELIKRHESPWVPPTLGFGAAQRFCDGPNQPRSTLEYWDGWSNRRRTTFLPYEIAQGGFKLPVHVVASTGGSLSRLKVEVVLQENEGYRLLDPVPKNVAELLSPGISVGPSGVMMPNKARPTIDVYAYGREVHLLNMRLGGTPNLHRSPETGFALAALQNLLAITGHYDGEVNGSNDNRTRRAIKAAAKHYGTKSDDYVLLIARLVEDLP